MRAPRRNVPGPSPKPNAYRLRANAPLLGGVELVLQRSVVRMDGVHWLDVRPEDLTEFNHTIPSTTGTGAFRLVVRNGWISGPRVVLQIQHEYLHDKNGPLGIESDRVQDWRDARLEDLGVGPTTFTLADVAVAG
jgi:hypothetical protein